MKISILSISFFCSASLMGMGGQSSLQLTYEPFTIKDAIVAHYYVKAGGFNIAACGAAASDFNNPKAQFYARLAKDCQAQAQIWDARNTRALSPLNTDLKNPIHIGLWAIGTTILTIAVIKLIWIGLDKAFPGIFGKKPTSK
jgi:hypothetical protein